MKKILSFDKFIIQEAEQSDTATKPNSLIPKRNSAVVLKEFLAEIKTHIIYWFTYGEISKMLIADSKDITLEKRGLCIWAVETGKDNEQTYQWRIKITEAEQEGTITRIEKLKLMIDVFDYNREYLIKSKERFVDIKSINEDYLISKIKQIKSTILKVPKTKQDVKDFKSKEKNMLSDDIY